jgi:hypothetical protein
MLANIAMAANSLTQARHRLCCRFLTNRTSGSSARVGGDVKSKNATWGSFALVSMSRGRVSCFRGVSIVVDLLLRHGYSDVGTTNLCDQDVTL